MFSRLKGMGIILAIFVGVSIIYYEKAISQSLIMKDVVEELNILREKVVEDDDRFKIVFQVN